MFIEKCYLFKPWCITMTTAITTLHNGGHYQPWHRANRPLYHYISTLISWHIWHPYLIIDPHWVSWLTLCLAVFAPRETCVNLFPRTDSYCYAWCMHYVIVCFLVNFLKEEKGVKLIGLVDLVITMHEILEKMSQNARLGAITSCTLMKF